MGRHNDKNIKLVVDAFIGNNKKVANGFYATQISKIWTETMGNMIAGYTSKIALYDGILTIYLTSSPLRKELSMGKEKIISLINEAMGSNIVREVRLM